MTDATRPRPPPAATARARHRHAGHTTITVSGEIDLATAGQLCHACQAAVAAGATHVQLDLSGVIFCDAIGIDTLLALHRATRTRGTRLTCINTPPHLRRLFRLTAADRLL